MLYISKQLTKSKFMVMDTDDGIEQPASREELYDYVMHKGLDIKGVDYIKDSTSGEYNLSIEPYMIESNSKLSKQAVLNGVVMTVTNGCLTRLSFNNSVRGGSTINLADYCNSIADYAIDACENYKGDKPIVLVLDSSIKVASKAFKNLHSYIKNLVHVDVSKCSDKTANSVYRAILGNDTLYLFDNGGFSIIDTNETRKNFNIAFQVITYGLPYMVRQVKFEEVVDYSDEVNSLIDKVLSKSFNQLYNCSFHINTNIRYPSGSLKENIISNLGFDYNRNDALSDSFLMLPSIRRDILKSIGKYTTVNKVVCEQLYRYIEYVNRNKEFTEIYLSVAKRYIEFLRSL